ncbi:MAG: non-canonical purine NTP pyrophosphatase, RdgB/HAM1 family [Desulfuromonadales bacterium GWD2_61_12]|nr:MAG: non-canonical purine NTP pyrophosphatase, RdgB/HAM1 family [Desulfuromonadales bacterium GWC2_61_20]OGR32735.1 MAG: non-canonical purine NTP pyrophosphatase, RdgB/HAM1 family [Desulfuromonadales bacterium GWD2_61_12]HAD03173.1 non-canonical purine NTP pyrophosphatase [Desulfuromonas sp.]HBT83357.1 non-canonical purine NTP pyrophosphatase [Desulfuromonas sp.]
MQLLVATGNQGKLKEIRLLLAASGLEVVGLDSLSAVPQIEEDGATFAANALKKGETMARLSGCLTLADDSGLEVDALGGAPGVHSARYAGIQGDDDANNRKLLVALKGLPREHRRAAFVCAMALCPPDAPGQLFFGRLPGIILDEARGSGGFGYDPFFLVTEYGQTLAELPVETKNRISHRGQALRQALEVLQRM